jgi:hypothetical protein
MCAPVRGCRLRLASQPAQLSLASRRRCCCRKKQSGRPLVLVMLQGWNIVVRYPAVRPENRIQRLVSRLQQRMGGPSVIELPGIFQLLSLTVLEEEPPIASAAASPIPAAVIIPALRLLFTRREASFGATGRLYVSGRSSSGFSNGIENGAHLG